MADRPPVPLHYFSFYPQDWLSSPVVRRMTLSQRGRFMDLLCLAFGNGVQEPSLEANDLKVAAAIIKSQFSRRDDGRYYNAKLTDVWNAGQEAHAKAVRRGEASGRARASKRNQVESVSKQSRNEKEQAPLVMDLDSQKDYLPRGAGALAPSEARPATAPQTGTQDVRRPGGMTRLLDVMAKMGLKPEPAR